LRISAVVAAACLGVALIARAQVPAPPAPAPDQVQQFLSRLEQIVRTGDVLGYLDLVSGNANRSRATDFSRTEIQPGATRAVVKERERIPFGSTERPTGYRLVVDVFIEFGDMGRVATWQIDLQRRSDGTLEIFDQVRLTTVDRLFRLSLSDERQFSAQNLTI